MQDTFPEFVRTLFLAFCFARCVFLPVMIVRKLRHQQQKPQPGMGSARKKYLPGIIMTLLFAAIALLAAITNRIPVFGSSRVQFRTFCLAFAFLILNLVVARVEWKFTPDYQKKRLVSWLPNNSRERTFWLFVSMAAGVGEEIVFRAVLFGIFNQLTGNWWMAAISAAALFVSYHLTSGLVPALSVFLPALGLQWLVLISGGLYISMGVHLHVKIWFA
jgi:membrane protease YdiL (CAAX protease family)